MSRNLPKRFFNQPISKTVTLTLCATIFIGLSAPIAMAWPWDTKPGDGCKPAGTAKIMARAPYRCDLNIKKKLVWLPNPAIIDKTRALALVAQACNEGTVQSDDSQNTFDFPERDWVGFSDSYAESIDWYAHTPNNELKKEFALDLRYGNYISSALTVAATLDDRWSRFLTLWNQSISSVQKVLDQRKLSLFAAVDSGITPQAYKISSLCNLAHEEIKSKVSVEHRTVYTWVLRNGAGLFPDSPLNWWRNSQSRVKVLSDAPNCWGHSNNTSQQIGKSHYDLSSFSVAHRTFWASLLQVGCTNDP